MTNLTQCIQQLTERITQLTPEPVVTTPKGNGFQLSYTNPFNGTVELQPLDTLVHAHESLCAQGNATLVQGNQAPDGSNPRCFNDDDTIYQLITNTFPQDLSLITGGQITVSTGGYIAVTIHLGDWGQAQTVIPATNATKSFTGWFPPLFWLAIADLLAEDPPPPLSPDEPKPVGVNELIRMLPVARWGEQADTNTHRNGIYIDPDRQLAMLHLWGVAVAAKAVSVDKPAWLYTDGTINHGEGKAVTPLTGIPLTYGGKDLTRAQLALFDHLKAHRDDKPELRVYPTECVNQPCLAWVDQQGNPIVTDHPSRATSHPMSPVTKYLTSPSQATDPDLPPWAHHNDWHLPAPVDLNLVCNGIEPILSDHNTPFSFWKPATIAPYWLDQHNQPAFPTGLYLHIRKTWGLHNTRSVILRVASPQDDHANTLAPVHAHPNQE